MMYFAEDDMYVYVLFVSLVLASQPSVIHFCLSRSKTSQRNHATTGSGRNFQLASAVRVCHCYMDNYRTEDVRHCIDHRL